MSGPLPRALLPVTIPLSWLYCGGVAVRNAWHDRCRDEDPVPLPVISIGNINTGGTGKTPFTAWTCRALVEMGRLPLIAMRGYGAGRGHESDEMLEYAEYVGGGPIVVDPDRKRAIREVMPRHDAAAAREPPDEWPSFDCVIMDDGFQHRRMERDLDLVLIDAERDTFRDRLLPAGHLREPLANLRRADAVIITRCARVDAAIHEQVMRYHGRAPLAWSSHEWAAIHVSSEVEPRCDLGWLRGRRVVVALGVGHPESVIRALERAGASTAARFIMADHQRYTPRHIERFRASCADADGFFTTGKDWMKLRQLIDPKAWPAPIIIPELELNVHTGGDALRERLRSVVEAKLSA